MSVCCKEERRIRCHSEVFQLVGAILRTLDVDEPEPHVRSQGLNGARLEVVAQKPDAEGRTESWNAKFNCGLI